MISGLPQSLATGVTGQDITKVACQPKNRNKNKQANNNNNNNKTSPYSESKEKSSKMSSAVSLAVPRYILL